MAGAVAVKGSRPFAGSWVTKKICGIELATIALVSELGSDALERLLVEIEAEFPRFRIIQKSDSWFQRLIHQALVVVTFGQMREYLDCYHTTLGQRIYVTPAWPEKSKAERYLVLAHERVHMRQFRRFTWPGMTLLYLLIPLPMGLAYARAYFEMEAYAESIRAAAEIYGRAHVEAAEYREYILKQFTGPTYGWMWPFPRYLENWYEAQLKAL